MSNKWGLPFGVVPTCFGNGLNNSFFDIYRLLIGICVMGENVIP